MGIVADKKDWGKYADAVGDTNPIHSSDSFAKNVGLDGATAPGMWLASHIGGDNICSAKFWFKLPVYEGEILRVEDDSLYRGDDVVCSGELVYGDPVNDAPVVDKEYDYFKSFRVDDKSFKDYKKSLSRRGGSLELYLMSFSAPALIHYGKENGLGGVHASQSMKVLKPFSLEDIGIGISPGKSRGAFHKFEMDWISGEDVFASGEAIVLSSST